MKEEFILELRQLLDKYKIAATTQISTQLLAGMTEVPKDIQEIMLLISKIESTIIGKDMPVPSQTVQQQKKQPVQAVVPSTPETKMPPVQQNITQKEDVPQVMDVIETNPIEGETESALESPAEDYNDEYDYEIPEENYATSYDSNPAMSTDENINVESNESNEVEDKVVDESMSSVDENADGDDTMFGATIIGEGNNRNLTQTSDFIEEFRKPASSFVFDKYKILASHFGAPGASEIELYIAPLVVADDISNASNVPIVVHAYCAGQWKTASSYDIIDEGKNMVTLDIGDFCLLCRGNFVNGIFVSNVLTTGISANQGDSLQFLSKMSGAQTPVQGNGHLKFKDEEGAVYEIFPLDITNQGKDSKAEYICIKQGAEFLDYFVVANGYGVPKIRIAEKNQEIIVGWMGSTLEAEII